MAWVGMPRQESPAVWTSIGISRGEDEEGGESMPHVMCGCGDVAKFGSAPLGVADLWADLGSADLTDGGEGVASRCAHAGCYPIVSVRW